METFINFNWISLFALSIALLLFIFIYFISKKIKWIYVILISLLMGIGVGYLFKSNDNSYLKWLGLIGDIYIRLITAMVAPVILVSIISSFITLKNKDSMKKIGIKSIIWLLTSALLAILLSIILGTTIKLGRGAGAIFEDINSVSSGTINAYSGLTKSFEEVLINLFPSNIIADIQNNNVVAIIIIAIALAVGYISVAQTSGEDKVVIFKDFINASKRIIYRILANLIKLTPYAVLAILSSSAAKIFTNVESLIQLLILVVSIYLVAIVHTYIINGLLIKFVTKLSPIKFFKHILPAQVTAFSTQSSVGTLPITIKNLKDSGVNEEIANFTAPLGTTIGMPGCTAIWPTLLVIFFINATGIEWGFGNYIILIILSLFLSLGSAGVPGIAIVSSISLFGMLNLPVAAVILLMPINTISDMIRTLDNVSTAAVSSVLVAKNVNELDIEKFNDESNKDNESVKEDYINNLELTDTTIIKKSDSDELISEDQVCHFTPRKKDN